MQIVILSKRGWHADELCRALRERGHASRLLPYEGLVARFGRRGTEALVSSGVSVLDADALLARFIPAGSLEQMIYRVDALHWIEEHGVPVMNSPRAIERSVDKFYTDARLREAGLPTPDTVVCEGMDEAMSAIRAMLGAPGRRSLGEGGDDVIVKPIFGSMGHGIVRVGDPDTAFRVLQTLDQLRAVCYVQRAIDTGGRDVRAFVVGGRVLGAIERRAEGADWRTNVSRGGSARPFEMPPEWASLAVRAAAVVGADYAGVDLLPARNGEVFVLEVNGVPGWHGLQRATGIDVAGAVVEHLTARVRASRTVAVESAP